ncbi:MAG: hypothetical protein PVG14_14505 [Anaerolineales bacterium]
MTERTPEHLYKFPDGTHLRVLGERLFLTANSTGLAIAQLLYPEIEPSDFIDHQFLVIPQQEAMKNLPMLLEALQRLDEFHQLLDRPTPKGFAFGPYEGVVKEDRALWALRERLWDAPDKRLSEETEAGEAELEAVQLAVVLQELVECGVQSPGVPQRKNIANDLRVDYLLEYNISDLPDHKLQLSHSKRWPTELEWRQILSAWPWPLDPTPHPVRREARGRFFLLADLPNRV